MPIPIGQVGARSRTVIVRNGATTWLGFDEPDDSVVLEDFDVVADLAQAFVELLGEFVGAGHPFVQDCQDLRPKFMGQGFDQGLVYPYFAFRPSLPFFAAFGGLALCRQSDSSDRAG